MDPATRTALFAAVTTAAPSTRAAPKTPAFNTTRCHNRATTQVGRISHNHGAASALTFFVRAAKAVLDDLCLQVVVCDCAVFVNLGTA